LQVRVWLWQPLIPLALPQSIELTAVLPLTAFELMAMHVACAVSVATPQLGQPDQLPIWHEYVTQGARVQLRDCDWQLPQSIELTDWPELVMHVATAVDVATPQLGQALHWPREHAYVTQEMPVAHDCVMAFVLHPVHEDGETITPLIAQAL
jgi:hypothetical protein